MFTFYSNSLPCNFLRSFNWNLNFLLDTLITCVIALGIATEQKSEAQIEPWDDSNIFPQFLDLGAWPNSLTI